MTTLSKSIPGYDNTWRRTWFPDMTVTDDEHDFLQKWLKLLPSNYTLRVETLCF